VREYDFLLFIASRGKVERRNVKIIQSPAGSTHNPHLLTDQEEESTLKKHQLNKERLRVPRRPPWTKAITTSQLDRQEKDAFLEWRRGLAQYVGKHMIFCSPLTDIDIDFRRRTNFF
jgi:large subunit GTPase 1